MSARDEALEAVYGKLLCSEKRWPEGCAACRSQAEKILDAIPPAVLARLAIERDAFQDKGIEDYEASR